MQGAAPQEGQLIEVRIYTDGACSPNPGNGGWAALLMVNVGPDDVRSKCFSGNEENTTNQKMELMAAMVGLEALKKQCKVRLYTDSKYVINGATQWMDGWKERGWRTKRGNPVKYADLWRRIDRCTQIHDVNFIHVQGHSGIEWNEFVDDIAVRERLKLE